MIPNIQIQNPNISNVGIGNVQIRQPYIGQIGDARVWMRQPPQAIPIEVPVTVYFGAPIVNMPGCVETHKENTRDNKNMNLVNDDPKGMTILCDSGAPSMHSIDYQADKLAWQTFYGEPPNVDEGVNTGDPPTPPTPQTPEPPKTPPQSAEDVECPAPNARRIGDLNQAGTERVKEYKLIKEGTICETVWEPIPFVDQYLPSPAIITTTATIAAVATGSALLAKPLADLLLKVVKPVVKKAIGKIQTLLGKKPHRPTRAEIQADRYREKRGLLPVKKGPPKPLKKIDPEKKKKFLLF